MGPQEIETWISLPQADSKVSVSLTLLSVDTNPSLQLLAPAVKLPLSAPYIFHPGAVSTSQPPLRSPEQGGSFTTSAKDLQAGPSATPSLGFDSPNPSADPDSD